MFIGNGVDTDRFSPQGESLPLRKKLEISGEKKLVVYVGRLAPEKGIETLLRAFALLVKQREDVILVLAGRQDEGAPDWPQLSIMLHIPGSQIVFLGPLANTEDVFAVADLVVVPSECEESFGLTVVEGMASGKAVVGSDVGIFPELLGNVDSKLIFPAGNVEVLASRMSLWLNDQAASRLVGLQLRQLANERYSIERMVAEYEALLLA